MSLVVIDVNELRKIIHDEVEKVIGNSQKVEDKIMVDRHEAARRLNVTVQTIDNYRKYKKLKSKKIDGKVFVDLTHIFR